MTTDGGPSSAVSGAPISLAMALVGPAVLLGAFGTFAFTVGLDTDTLIVAMLLAATAAGAVAVRRGGSWADLERETAAKFGAVLPVVLILLAIGALIGTWVLSGTIPMLVALGVELIAPRFFVLTAFLVTCAMSICTGTSWGSAGTLGVALMGAGTALGAPLPALAGAVVSGAYFGDKLSPLSDSTNICALAANTGLYAHIRHMLFTSLPSFGVALLIYAFFAAPATGDVGAQSAAAMLLSDLRAHFDLGWWTWTPLLLVLGGVALRKPPALVLAASSAVAMVIGVVVQGFAPGSAVRSAISGFHAGMFPADAAPANEASALFLTLVNRGGTNSMAPTLVVILAAFLLAAAMQISGALDRILHALLAGVRSTFGLIGATMASGATLVSLTSHTGVTALIVGGLFQPAYAERGLANRNLSRTLEDSVTMTEALMPWTVSAIFFATTLGVATADYAAWAVFNWCSPLASLGVAFIGSRTGFGIRRLEP